MHCLALISLSAFLGLSLEAPLPSEKESYDYSSVLSKSRSTGIDFTDLPGFTRSMYQQDLALISPESRVWASQPGWKGATTAHLISRASGANFAMYLADLKKNGSAGAPPPGVERLIFVLDGSVTVLAPANDFIGELHADDFAYFPADYEHRITSPKGGGFLVFERIYSIEGSTTEFQTGTVADLPLIPADGEVFALRKLLPQTGDYDFNVHIMDFRPGEYLNVKEIHYNQHGLLLLQGQGIYRLADKWFPIQAGDALWMAPYVVQWYAALGKENSRYILYKDTTIDPLYFV